MRTYTILTLASALLVSATAFSQAPDGARLRPPVRPTLTMQSGKNQRFGTIFFSPDGKRLAGVSVAGHIGEPAIYVWDASTGRQLFTRSWHKKTALSVHFNDDGTLLVASAPLPSEKHGGVQLWDPVTMQSLSILKGADAGPGKELQRFAGHGVCWVEFSVDGKQVRFGTYPGLIYGTPQKNFSMRLLDIESVKETTSFEGHIARIRFSPQS